MRCGDEHGYRLIEGKYPLTLATGSKHIGRHVAIPLPAQLAALTTGWMP